MPNMENDYWKRAKGKVIFIAGNNSLPVPLGWIYKRIRVLHRRLRGSTDRSHNVVLIIKKEKFIRGMDLEETSLREINSILEVRVGRKLAELFTLAPIHGRVCWQGNLTVVHWGLYKSGKGR